MSALIDLTEHSRTSPLFLKFFESLFDTVTTAANYLTPTSVSLASWRSAIAAPASEAAAAARQHQVLKKYLLLVQVLFANLKRVVLLSS
jgi:hypothetical protein